MIQPGVWEGGGLNPPCTPDSPSQPSLIRTRASYRKQSSCLMTSLLNPWWWDGGDLSLWICSVFFSTQTNPKKSTLWWLECLQRGWCEQLGGVEPPSPRTGGFQTPTLSPRRNFKLLNFFCQHVPRLSTLCGYLYRGQCHCSRNRKYIEHINTKLVLQKGSNIQKMLP